MDSLPTNNGEEVWTIDSKSIDCDEQIDAFVDSLDTGDLIFFCSGRFHSIISFTIMTVCNSEWTHSGMIIKTPKDGTVCLWESVNGHSEKSLFKDVRNGEIATNNGARLIKFSDYLKFGRSRMSNDGKQNCMFSVLKLNRRFSMNTLLKKKIENYVLFQSIHVKRVYPKSLLSLAQSWYDGWESCFVCCGLFSTYDVEMMHLEQDDVSRETLVQNHRHYSSRTHDSVEEIFCSQLIIETLEHTNLFYSSIPCQEWTVEDLTKGININTWWSNKINKNIGYVEQLQVKILSCKKY